MLVKTRYIISPYKTPNVKKIRLRKVIENTYSEGSLALSSDGAFGVDGCA